MTVFNASSDQLKGIIEYTGTPTDTSTVTVEEMGKMTKQADSSWVITKPMKIKFEELGIIQLKPKASLLEDFGAIKHTKREKDIVNGYKLNDLTTITFKF